MRQRDHTNELGDECVRCPRGSYNLDGSVWNDQSKPLQSGTLAPPDGFCLPCPRAGASCPGGSEVYAKEGWYTHEIERQSSRRISHGPPDDNSSSTPPAASPPTASAQGVRKCHKDLLCGNRVPIKCQKRPIIWQNTLSFCFFLVLFLTLSLTYTHTHTWVFSKWIRHLGFKYATRYYHHY